jgi:hypothetical protein
MGNALIPCKRHSKRPVAHAAALNRGCSNCIKTRLRCRRLPHLMPLALMRKRVVPAAG